jgi:hypothetical protein
MNILEILKYAEVNSGTESLDQLSEDKFLALARKMTKLGVEHFRRSKAGKSMLNDKSLHKGFHVPDLFFEMAHKTSRLSTVYATVYLLIFAMVKESYDSFMPPKFIKVESNKTMIGDKPYDLSGVYKAALVCLREYRIKYTILKKDQLSFEVLEEHFVVNLYLNMEHLFSYHSLDPKLDVVIPIEFFVRMFFIFQDRLPSFFYKELSYSPLFNDTYKGLKAIKSQLNHIL